MFILVGILGCVGLLLGVMGAVRQQWGLAGIGSILFILAVAAAVYGSRSFGFF